MIVDQIRSIGAEHNLQKDLYMKHWLLLLPASLSDFFSMLAVLHMINES